MTAPRPIRQMRLCAYGNCTTRFNAPHDGSWPARFCSVECWTQARAVARGARAHSTPRRADRRVQMPRTPTAKKRKAISPASPVQREATKDRACIVCASEPGTCDPAHLISRAAATEGQDEPLAVIALCRSCHDRYDGRREPPLDVLPYLEPHGRDVLAFAVERYGLLRTLQRVTNTEWRPVESERVGRAA